MSDVKSLLEREAAFRNDPEELSFQKPDPLLVARKHESIEVALLCALYGYGRADLIVKFLYSLELGQVSEFSEAEIKKHYSSHYYRFQNSEDVVASMILLRHLQKEGALKTVLIEAYKKECNIVDAINAAIHYLCTLTKHQSRGYSFLLGSPVTKTKGASALKRWLMFMRWMVRDDHLDMGYITEIDKADLIIPLDTHTFKTARRLSLLERKQYDLHAAIELTHRLKMFDNKDPVKYDFALYRLGQERIITD